MVKKFVRKNSKSSKKTTKKIHFNKKRIGILLLVVLAVSAVAMFYLANAEKNMVGDVKLNKVALYKAADKDSKNPTQQTNFKVGDNIQVGINYPDIDEKESLDALAQFVVVNRETGKSVFTTTLFRLDSTKEKLYININNTNLPVGKYTLEVRNVDGKTIASQNYNIKK